MVEELLQSAPMQAWIGFLAFVLVMLALDLGVFNRKAHVPSFKEATVWSCAWVTLALAFNALIWRQMGQFKGIEWFTAYVLEKSLSVDNLFVFVMVFSAFGVGMKNQHRILYWGILGALVLRAAMILGGTALLNRFEWMMYVFGAFLIWTGLKMFFEKEGEEKNPSDGMTVRLFRKIVPFDPDGGHEHFLTKKNGRWLATPMLLVLIVIEFTDLVFAVDSIPAVLAITRDTFVVFTSNVFAILGLRSLYFLLAKMMDRFRYLKVGLAIILTFVGVKMCLAHWAKARFGIADGTLIVFSLAFISAVLVGSIIFSLVSTKHLGESP
ncbi:MAG: TerC family protein [Holophagales bacterium]|nr:TerC family protein [Holophagales bacterium]